MGVAERHPRDCEMTRVIDHRLALAAASYSSGDSSHTQDPRCKKGEDEVTMILGRMGGREEDRPDMMKVPDKSLVLRTCCLL